MALLLTSVFGVTGCGSDDDVQAESRVKNAAPEASALSDAISEADCNDLAELLDLYDLDLDDLYGLDVDDLADALYENETPYEFRQRTYDLYLLLEQCAAASDSGADSVTTTTVPPAPATSGRSFSEADCDPYNFYGGFDDSDLLDRRDLLDSIEQLDFDDLRDVRDLLNRVDLSDLLQRHRLLDLINNVDMGRLQYFSDDLRNFLDQCEGLSDLGTDAPEGDDVDDDMDDYDDMDDDMDDYDDMDDSLYDGTGTDMSDECPEDQEAVNLEECLD
jgi:hypothetical protein